MNVFYQKSINSNPIETSHEVATTFLYSFKVAQWLVWRHALVAQWLE
jgi:hypothetical protein